MSKLAIVLCAVLFVSAAIAHPAVDSDVPWQVEQKSNSDEFDAVEKVSVESSEVDHASNDLANIPNAIEQSIESIDATEDSMGSLDEIDDDNFPLSSKELLDLYDEK